METRSVSPKGEIMETRSVSPKGEIMETRSVSPTGCDQVSRQTASHVVEDMLNRSIREQVTLLSLKQWLNYNPPPKDVEEYLWNLLAFKQR